MGQLTITLSNELEQQVRQYAHENGYDSVSDFMREVASKATSGRPTYWERTYLAHLMEIKQLLGASINEELLDALKGGYSKFYPSEGVLVAKQELSEEDMEFVMQVLEMYRDLQHGYSESAEKDTDIEEAVLFEGFDGNAGDGHFGFLQFLVKHDRYTIVKPLDKGYAINSHSHVTSVYQRMLAEYKSIKPKKFDPRLLTLAEVKQVIDARIHPEYRETEGK